MSCESNRPSQAAGSFPAVARRACGLRRARTPWYNRIGMSSEGVRLLRLQLKLAPQLQARGGWRGPLAAQRGGAAFDLAQAIIDRAAYLATEGARDEQSLLNTCSPARGAVLLHWLLLGSGRGAAAPGDNASRRAQVEARLSAFLGTLAAEGVVDAGTLEQLQAADVAAAPLAARLAAVEARLGHLIRVGAVWSIRVLKQHGAREFTSRAELCL